MLSWQAKFLNKIGPIVFSYYVLKSFLILKITKENWIFYIRRKLEKWARPPKHAIIKPVQVEKIKGLIVSYQAVQSNKIILFLHGGGFIVGTPKIYTELAFHISQATHCDVFLLDYRLAPEYSFPCANDDAFNAYQYLLQQGYQPENIIIAGDSAGGGLTIATLIAIRDNKMSLPQCAICLAPFFDFTFSSPSIINNRKKDYMLRINEAMKADVINLYLKDHDLKNPLISPLFADLTGLPPLLIQVGSNDVLLDDSLRFAENAKNYHVKITLEKWDQMPHDFHMLVRFLPEAQSAIKQIGDYIRKLA